MADRRMFSKKIVQSDAFLDMPLSTQCLYFHLNMEADDDGFVNSPKRIQRVIGATEDDLKLLIAKRFVLTFESGVIVIKHWWMHNTLRKDRYKVTQYQDEYNTLTIKENGAYTDGCQLVANWLPTGCPKLTETKLNENKLNQKQTNSVVENLTDEEWDRLDSMYEDIIGLIDFVDESINKRTDDSIIRNPFKYILAVAEANGWQRKRGMR